MTGRWAGRQVTNARAYWKTRLPQPCFRHGPRCTGVIDGTRPWVVEHIVERYLGGTDDVSNQAVSCRPCSDQSGGQHGARLTNARRRPPERTDPIETRPIRW